MACSGVAVFSPRIFDHWNRGATDLFGDVLSSLPSWTLPRLSGCAVSAVKTAESVLDIGTAERIVEADRLVFAPSRWPAVFWDRDGTLNDSKDGFVNCPHDYRLRSDAAQTINKLRARYYRSVCVTNQGGVELGFMTHRMLDRIHVEQDQQLATQGAYLDRVYYCPHFSETCECRKPKTGMIDLARRQIRIDMERSWLVGDSATDIECGKKAGIRTIQLMTSGSVPAGPTRYASSLSHAADIILGEQ
jgi:histidinol-phosphate phosphatase family protein